MSQNHRRAAPTIDPTQKSSLFEVPYCQSRRGNRLFELGLGPVALAFCAASSKTDHAAIGRILSEFGRDAFPEAWLADRGLLWAADLIPNLTNVEVTS